MEEAVEICKLRLFLKLVAQVERVEDVEPLPDIDFNVRAGNTLVGYATRAEVERALTSTATGQGKLMFAEEADALQRFEGRAADVERLFGLFRQQLTELGGQVTAEDKAELRRRLDALVDELNRALAREYGVDEAKPKAYKDWLASHRPLHWFVEFYGILRQGGFSVIIGNPPYVVYAPDKVGYKVEPADYSTLRTRNLYPLVFERSLNLVRQNGLAGLIVQLTALSSERLPPLQDLLMARGSLYALAFPRRPESIFDGVEMPVAILLSLSDKRQTFVTSRVQRFYTEERDVALQRMTLTPHLIRADGHRIAKIRSVIEQSIYQKIAGCDEALGFLIRNDLKWSVYYQEACRYWAKAGLHHQLRHQVSDGGGAGSGWERING